MIDCFPFFNELDLLEVRLHALAPYVTRFVLAESEQTHSGNPKPLHFMRNFGRFSGFPIQPVLIPDCDGSPWEREAAGRKWLLEAVAEGDPEEIILISDVDEIPNLASYQGGEGVFRQRIYSYYFNCFTGRANWRGTFARKRKHLGADCIDPLLRKKYKETASVVGDGWHFSNIGTAEAIIEKLEAFAHQELNTAEIHQRVREGRDHLLHWNRDPRPFRLKPPSGPAWLLENKERYPTLWRMAT